ncbi:MAG TPA: hypothetical protein P5305_08830 [Rubrivivax sp.]|nr:hypothetical protein [Rubrivivax sp.]HRY87979.1 hypothetical protein [Rubrivivax sp.]
MNQSDFSFSRKHGLMLPSSDLRRSRDRPAVLTLGGSVSGHFKMEAVRPDGSRRFLAEFDNLITDIGLERWGTGAIIGWCRAGSGSTEPSVGDTSLAIPVAATNNTVFNAYGAQASAPYFGWYTTTYRFATGAAAGNISEVGIGWESTGSTLWSRALVLDGEGEPTTVTVLSDEVLDVTYTLRLYPPLTDTTFALTMSGVEYTVTARAAYVTGVNAWCPYPLSQIGANPSHYPIVYAGTLGAITSTPSGTANNGPLIGSPQAYSATSHQRDILHFWDLLYGNIGDVTSVVLPSSLGVYQFQFSPTFNKIGTKQLSLTLRVSWARRP